MCYKSLMPGEKNVSNDGLIQINVATNQVIIGFSVGTALQVFTLFMTLKSFHAQDLWPPTSIRPSIRFFILRGSGRKRLASCLVTSFTRSLCVMCLRFFMIRTMHAWEGRGERQTVKEAAQRIPPFDAVSPRRHDLASLSFPRLSRPWMQWY
jgi:hypothetical protein